MRVGDGYGAELMAHFNGEKSFEIVERSDGYFEASMGASVYFSSYRDWPPREKQAMKFVHGRVLDIGCGAGRHALYLQKEGHDVTGIDISCPAIKVCKLRGLRKAKNIPIERIDVFPDGSFDSVLMMFNNFGLFGNFRKAKRLLKVLHRITSADARIIAETMDPYKTSNPDHRWYHEWNKRHGRMGGQLRLRIRFRKTVGHWFDYLLVSKKELNEILDGTGWKLWKTIDVDFPRYVAVIRKRE